MALGINNFLESIFSFVNDIRDIGQTLGIDYLTIDKWLLPNDITQHSFAIIASALSKTNTCYYRCPDPNGAVYVALADIDDKVFEPMTHLLSFQLLLIFVEGFLIQNGHLINGKKILLLHNLKRK